MQLHQMEDTWQLQYRHFDQDERQTDGSRHWDSIKPVLLRAFAQEGARDFDAGAIPISP